MRKEKAFGLRDAFPSLMKRTLGRMIHSFDLLQIHPYKLISGSFIALILLGAILLSLPIAASNGEPTPFTDALFTATSASCVTGLVVVDTGTHWSLFGQLVILLLIQTGGLGIITFTTFFTVLLGKRLTLRGRILVQESLNDYSLLDVTSLLKNVFLITITIEFVGAVILSTRFIPDYGWLRGIYMGVFHSISAFCNAGFDVIGNFRSLTEYNDDPVVLVTIDLLIITGGLGFIVWRDLANFRRTRQLHLHTKVVLTISSILLAVGTIAFLAFEYNNPETMGPLSFPEKLNAAFFHSTASRTAGYNSLPLGDMKEISKILTIFLMFVGASPGSTGGGIKTTTFGVLIFAILSEITGNHETIMLKRRVPYQVVNKSLAITGLGLSLVFFVTVIILSIQDFSFIDVLYEVTSAFGTVGLSTGITPNLNLVSKMLIAFTMFLGRIGTLTFIIAISVNKEHGNNHTICPEGKIVVG